MIINTVDSSNLANIRSIRLKDYQIDRGSSKNVFLLIEKL